MQEYRADQRAPGPLRSIAIVLFNMIVIHYLLWPFAWAAGLYFLHSFLTGAAGRLYAWLAIGSILALYTLSFLDGSQYRGRGRPWHWVRRLKLWRLGHEYMGLRMLREAVLNPARKYVFGYHPHGILILSRLSVYGNVWEEMFPGIETRVLGASPIFWWPGSREVSLALGAVDASNRVAAKVLKEGLSVIVYPGGSAEIFTTDARSKVTTMILRKGFVHLAMQAGADLVPTVVYNERNAYTRVDLPQGFKNWCLRKLRVPVLLFFGRWMTLLPNKPQPGQGLGIVFGKPITTGEAQPQLARDDPAVQAKFDEYVAALKELWERRKADFGYGAEDTLQIQVAGEGGSHGHRHHQHKKQAGQATEAAAAAEAAAVAKKDE